MKRMRKWQRQSLLKVWTHGLLSVLCGVKCLAAAAMDLLNMQLKGSVLFLFGAGEFREVDFLIVQNVKRGTKATHLERSNGNDPELNLKFRESDGSVRLQCFLTERKHIMRLPDQTIVYWSWRPAGRYSRGEGNVTIKGLATSREGTIKGEENTNLPGRFTGHQSAAMQRG